MTETKRFFTIDASSTKKTGGRYNSATPMSAATKAARRIFREADSHVNSIRFIIRETTRSTNSSNKRHYYTAKRTHSTRTFVKAGKTFKVEFDVEVKMTDETHVKDLLHTLGA